MAMEGGHLVAAVMDNGDTIPRTIDQVFNADPSTASLLQDLSAASSSATEGAEQIAARHHAAIHYATLPGHTSRPGSPRENRGLGLTYVVEKTIEYQGTILIRSGAVAVRYGDAAPKEGFPSPVASWPGTLLKIKLPIRRARGL